MSVIITGMEMPYRCDECPLVTDNECPLLGIDVDEEEGSRDLRCPLKIEALEQEPKYCDRNICIQNEYNGIGCVECEVTKSGEPCGKDINVPATDAISRQSAIDACLNGWNKDYKEIVEEIRTLPPVTPQPKIKMERCKDCKYFEYNSVAKIDGVPLIVAHEICSRWGDGCKTREDGYCFLFEPQESEDKE